MSDNNQEESEKMEAANNLPAQKRDAGFWKEFWRQTRLVWYLFWDPEVPVYLKLLPAAAVLYAIFPIDLIPDVIIGLGQLDDLTILLLGGKVFIEMAPPEIVSRYMTAMRKRGEVEGDFEDDTAVDEVTDAIIIDPKDFKVAGDEKDQAN